MSKFQDFITQNPLKCFLAGRTGRHRRAVTSADRLAEKLERSEINEIYAEQERALRDLLARAERTPFYRNLSERLGKPVTGVTLADLPRLPFLTKAIMQEQGDRLRIPGARGVFENYSGGSTGVPARFWQDERYKVQMSVATKRSNQLAGAFPGARVAKLWGAPQDKRKIEGWLGRTKLWLLNQRYYDTFDMAPHRMTAYHEDLERFQPDIIQAYASSVYLYARFLKAHGIRPAYPRISIISSAEKLFPHMRAEIEEVFPVKVFDRYGSREVSAMAAECERHEGLHIQMPGYILETIDPVTLEPVAGRPGEIVITVLYNHAMPFIRYRIGDMGILETSPCACGRTFHRLREVVGRTSDNFLMPDGRIVHGEYFTHIFYGREGIEQFQFVQHEREEFSLQIVPAAGYRAATSEEIEREVRQMIGPAARLRLELRDEIPKTSSGKYRFTVSHVDVNGLVGGRA
jgi:phenylacetate-CoA ligase